MNEQEFSNNVADLLMNRVMGILCVAAGPDAQRGGRYLINLGGDLAGKWLLSLQPGHVGVERAHDDKADAKVDWRLSYGEVADILSGHYDFVAAEKSEKLVVDGKKTAGVNLMRAFDAMGKVNLMTCLQNPGAYVAEQFRTQLLAGQSRKTSKKTRGVQLRK